ncbi:MAG: N-acetylmuramoyl-L-alanine amidase [Tidjanibacter sp.]|nr:N-acetylmuramoyl-L-alanine amidase [Tidjanibacter sp.]
MVLDAGHGGKDPGCSWGDKLEKNLNLNIVLTLGEMIEQAYPDVEVIYTRKDDRFIELHERGNIANRAGADLFISVHTDAVSNTEAHGSSTYIMGNDKSEKNLAVAQRENSVIVLEGDYEAKYEGYDPNSAESFIIFSLMQYAHAEQSMVFAEMVQKHYARTTKITDRGARQGPYLVLWRTAMPSVLTEVGFMTNKGDREYLHSKEGQAAVCKALFDAFSEYRTRCNTKAGESVAGVEPKQAEQPKVKVEVKTEQPKANVEVKTEQPKVDVKVEQPKTNVVVKTEQPKANVEVKTEQPKVDVKVEQPKTNVVVKTEQPKAKTEVKAEVAKPKAEATAEPKYFVQLCTLSAKSNPNDGKFGAYKGRIVQAQTATGKWRCMVAAESLQTARTLATEANQKGFRGAFVVALKGGEYNRVN